MEYRILSYYSDVYRLFTFLAFAYLKLNLLTFVETAKTFFVNTRVVNKNVATRLGCDEAITFGRIKPFYSAFHKNVVKITLQRNAKRFVKQ